MILLLTTKEFLNMLIRLTMTFCLIAICFSNACQPKVENTPEPGTQEEHLSVQDALPFADDDPAQPDLDFSLSIDGQELNYNRPVRVSEGTVSSIDFISNDVKSAVLSILQPDGNTIPLGEWQTEIAQFVYRFPYGENHIILGYGDNVYDFTVIAGVQESAETDTGCEGSFVSISQDSKWVFQKTSETDSPATWTQSVRSWDSADDGEMSFSIMMERSSGVEGNINHAIELFLFCQNGVFYVDTVNEQEDGMIMVTKYEDNSVYVPASINIGTIWERRGTTDIIHGEDMWSMTIRESQTCTGIETIVVEAGEFDAYKVEFTIEKIQGNESQIAEGTSWYVPGLGRVMRGAEIPGFPRMELINYENLTPRL